MTRKEVSRWPWKGSCLRPAISRCPPRAGAIRGRSNRRLPTAVDSRPLFIDGRRSHCEKESSGSVWPPFSGELRGWWGRDWRPITSSIRWPSLPGGCWSAPPCCWLPRGGRVAASRPKGNRCAPMRGGSCCSDWRWQGISWGIFRRWIEPWWPPRPFSPCVPLRCLWRWWPAGRSESGSPSGWRGPWC